MKTQAQGEGQEGRISGGFLPSYFLGVLIRSKSFNSDGIIIQYLYLISLNSCVMLYDTKQNNSKGLMIAKQAQRDTITKSKVNGEEKVTRS